MDRDGFITETELKDKIKEEEFLMNLSSFNRFLLKRFQKRIELVEADEIIQTFADENVNEDVLKEAVQYCYEQTLESNQIVDREYRSFYKLMNELDELVERDDDTFKILQKMEKGEDVFVWELYSIALNKLYHPRIRRFLISIREMETVRR